jgi:hypothetical protein
MERVRSMANSPRRQRRLGFEHLEPRWLFSVSPVGGETQINTYTSNQQTNPKIAADAVGDYVVVWESYGQDGSQEGVYAQRYASSGSALGSEFRVNTFTAGNQVLPAVAMDSAGDFVVAWSSYGEDGSKYGVYAQRYASTGSALGSEFRVNTFTSGNQGAFFTTNQAASHVGPAVAMDATGDFVVAWQSYAEDGNKYGIYAQRYASTGSAQGSEFRVNSHTSGEQIAPAVAMDAAGDFVIAWQSYDAGIQDGSRYGIYAQRYASTGSAQGSEFRVNSYTSNQQTRASVSMDVAGDFVIAWQSQFQDGVGYGVFAQRFNAAGATQGSEFQANTYTTNDQAFPSVALDSAGDFVIAWSSIGEDGSLQGIYARHYSSAGAADGGEFQVNTYTTIAQQAPSVAMDAAGDFVIAWQSNTQDGSQYGIFAQRYTPSQLVIDATSQTNNVVVSFTDSSHFTVSINGSSSRTYSTSTATSFTYNAPADALSTLQFVDKFNAYAATQTFTSTQLTRSGFTFTGSNVTTLYVYSVSGSTATVNVSSTSAGNYFALVTTGGYEYIANPSLGIYSELAGFGSETVSGSDGSTYAYVYSTSHGSGVGDPTGSSYSVNGLTTTLANFPQVYFVGAADGTDSINLHSAGGQFVATPGFSYVGGSSGGNSFLIGALYAAVVKAQAGSIADTAYFYSYPGNTFAGTPGTTSALIGTTNNVASQSVSFTAQAAGYQAVTVLESGSNTDTANLTSPGNGTFVEVPTVSTLMVAANIITVNTYTTSGSGTVPVPATINATGAHNGTDTANLYDDAGTNTLTVGDSTAVLKTAANTVTVDDFGAVEAYQQSGNDNTVFRQSAIDYALALSGSWING